MGDGGETFGFLSIIEARKVAQERGLDIVEVAPEANPPVCKLMDMGKHKYKQKKRLQEQKRHQHTVELKEIWLRPRIDQHDLNVKLNKAKNFLKQGFRVAMTMRFRAREILHKEIGKNILEEVGETLKEFGKIDSEMKSEARKMQIIIAPNRVVKGGGNSPS
jgi:translation initiation factor IF-3